MLNRDILVFVFNLFSSRLLLDGGIQNHMPQTSFHRNMMLMSGTCICILNCES